MLKRFYNLSDEQAEFHKFLDDLGLFVNEGKIVNASFVVVPRQRNKKEEHVERDRKFMKDVYITFIQIS